MGVNILSSQTPLNLCRAEHQRRRDIKPVPPATVFHTQVSTSTANIEWERPDGQYDHMVVTLTNLTTNETKEKVTEELCTTYTRLRPATWYRMDVMTIKGSKRSAIRSHILNTAPLPPTGISVNPGANIAKIYWTYPDKRDDDGITFEINCWEVNARRPEPCLTASSKALETILKPLTPGSQYKVQVKAVFQETRNNDFKEALFSTEPPAVSNVQVQGFSTFADVSWRPPVEGKVKRYDIVFWRANNPSAKRKTTVQYPAVTGSIINLNQGTKYVAEVKSSVEGRVSQGGDRKTFYTVPSRPSMGNIDTAPDSIRLKWSRKEDEPDVTEAVVTYCLPGSTQKITKHVSTREPQQLLISPLNPNTHIEGYVELVSGDKTSDKTHWSATTDS
ncbi:tenascin-X-like [Lingula anatina]|uniref:Tenascin-X-like n=1 Tax=Lingula anatina TaxID=7574 RepID=A0A1S3H590_LINAN|nr:tenascin-X-like [Lingula anatina]|eukprot:XP_013381173.1 tenascin-X-like [Lingula anatina]